MKISIVTPTYGRESHIEKTAEKLKLGIWGQNNEPMISWFIVDNGCSLDPRKIEHRGVIKIFSNLNAGGAGGFARGLLEVMRAGGYTHVVFSDDDIDIDPEAYLRIFSYYSYLIEPDLFCISGAMLRTDVLGELHECGAILKADFRVAPLKNGLNVCQRQDLLEFEPENIDYGAWWFFAFPLSCAEKIGLPLTIFFRFDDVEYSLRLKKQCGIKFLTLNGVAVWHEPFDRKESSAAWFYVERNLFWLKALYFKNFSKVNLILEMFKRIAGRLLRFRYESAEMILLGMEQALRGPDYIAALEPDVNHDRIMHMVHERFVRLENRPPANDCSSSSFNKFLSLITLNGHLLPSPIRRLNESKMYSQCCTEKRLFLGCLPKSVMLTDRNGEFGSVASISSRQFIRLCWKAVKMGLKIMRSPLISDNIYKSRRDDFNSVRYWKEILKING